MTRKGIEIIKRFEGLRLKAYRCPAGVWTIGYGHTKGVKEGDVITEERAEELLKADTTPLELNVRCLIPADHTEYEVDALVSLAFNIGYEALRKSTLIRVINRGGTEEDIRHQFSRWVYAGGRQLPGLVARRKAEADLYFTPCEKENQPEIHCIYK